MGGLSGDDDQLILFIWIWSSSRHRWLPPGNLLVTGEIWNSFSHSCYLALWGLWAACSSFRPSIHFNNRRADDDDRIIFPHTKSSNDRGNLIFIKNRFIEVMTMHNKEKRKRFENLKVTVVALVHSFKQTFTFFPRLKFCMQTSVDFANIWASTKPISSLKCNYSHQISLKYY